MSNEKMEFKNEELEQEIDDFFEKSKQNFDEIFNQIGLDVKEVCPDESEQFLIKRTELLNGFEEHLLKNCTILKDLEATDHLTDQLNEKISKLLEDEHKVKNDLDELAAEKENLREMLGIKSTLIKESVIRKKEIEQIGNEKVKEQFVNLCKYMNLKFQWNQNDKKFTIVFLSSNSDVNQVKQINSKKLLDNDENYVKKLREHFKLKLLQLV